MILNLYKPVGWTSFDVVKRVRRIAGIRKVGHGGTLDPFAEGVLVVATGPDTKRLVSITNAPKTYEARLQLGAATDTLDATGRTTATAPVPEITPAVITTVLESFVGQQSQIPPMYSAKQVDGVRLYRLARRNITVRREPVEITIHTLELLEHDGDRIDFRVLCSKGTYVRVLGADIAQRLGTVGHLVRLVRTRVGDFTSAEALTPEQLAEQWKSIAA